MASRDYLSLYPQRIPWIGMATLGGAFLFSLPFLWMIYQSSVSFPFFEVKKGETKKEESISFSLALKSQAPCLPIPHIQEEMTFSHLPERPSEEVACRQVLIRLKQSGQSRRVQLPCRVGFQYEGERLLFSKEDALFWMELSLTRQDQIEGKVFVKTADANIEAGAFTISPQETPIQNANEFGEGSPFRTLAEAKWLGHDLVREQYKMGPLSERVEIANSGLMDLNEDDWLIWGLVA